MALPELHHQRFKRTRLAPTPSGYLHLGNILSFLITAELARRSGARVLLRIDDLDRARVRPGYLRDIFDTLPFLGIGWDEGPRSPAEFEEVDAQRHRLPLYRAALEQLRRDGLVFACTCSRTQLLSTPHGPVYSGHCASLGLDLDTPGACWRLHTGEGKTTIQTLFGPEQATLPPKLRHFIVRKKDGWPSYQLASLIDDLHYGIDLIVRGADLWPSTIAQHLLAQSLQHSSFRQICFYHHPLVTGPDGLKLSKSAGDTSIHGLRALGWTAAQIKAKLLDENPF